MLIPLPLLVLQTALSRGPAFQTRDEANVAGQVAPEIEIDASAASIVAYHDLCSGVLVSERIALTAAHCVADLEFGQQVTLETHPLGGGTLDQHQVTAWGIHPEYCPSCRDDQYDVAFVELTLPLEDPVVAATPDTQATWGSLVRPGSPVRVVGFGDDSTGQDGVRIAAAADIASVTGVDVAYGSSEGAACEGDSGAPVFARGDDGRFHVVAIHSRSNGCPTRGTATNIYAAACWLRDETGVDLTPSDDPDCEGAPGPRDGCSIAATSRSPLTAFVALTLLLRARRRRCPFSHGL